MKTGRVNMSVLNLPGFITKIYEESCLLNETNISGNMQMNTGL